MHQGNKSGTGQPDARAQHLSLVPGNTSAGQVPGIHLDPDLLSVALELSDQAIQGMPMGRRGYASLLALVYEGVASGIPYDLLLDFARSKAAEFWSRDSKDALAPQDRVPGS